MITITAEQIERVNLILSGVPGGIEKALSSTIRRANNTVRSETLKGITTVYAITRQNVRAETTIKVRTQSSDGGIVGTVLFAGHKIPLYRFNVSPTIPIQRATVSAAVLAGNGRTPFQDAFIARMQSGHILERQVNGGAWAQVYKGINRSYTDAITFGWTSIAYRVKAYDSAGAESAYQTSATRTVVNNHAPVISGTDSNLGTKTAAFAQSYSVTDEDSGQTLTVTEYIDGTQKRSYTATSGQTYSFNITAAEWVKLLNGSHTLKIVAADNYGGSATRTYTFTKNETEIELTLATPLTADDMVTKGIMSVVRQIPAGAKFTVEVCNNGNDASPTWEDVTQNVVSGSKFFLSNTTKTASAWGYNFRIKVKRGTATGDCFITSAGGNFE